MKRIIALALCAIPQLAASQVQVDGHYRRDSSGNYIYIPPHYRTPPNANPYDNYTYPGNVNPYHPPQTYTPPTYIPPIQPYTPPQRGSGYR